jgi:hypothetical protein
LGPSAPAAREAGLRSLRVCQSKRLDLCMHHIAHAAGSPFYESGTFWTAAGFFAVVASILVGVIIWRLGLLRRVITYSAEVTPLLARRLPQSASAKLSVFYDNQEITQPHLAILRVICKGRGDISSADFDRGRPLVIDIGARIITTVNVAEDQSRIDVRNLAADGSKLRVGPCVIRPGPVFKMDLITDGPPSVTCQGNDNPLVNVRVREGEPRETSAGARVLAVAGTVALFGFGLAAARSTRKVGGAWGQVDPAAIGVLIGMFTAALVTIAFPRLSRQLAFRQRITAARRRENSS